VHVAGRRADRLLAQRPTVSFAARSAVRREVNGKDHHDRETRISTGLACQVSAQREPLPLCYLWLTFPLQNIAVQVTMGHIGGFQALDGTSQRAARAAGQRAACLRGL
jgi:hypothetical protein